MGDAFFFANRQRLVELSLTNRMPLIVSGNPEFAVAGALMSYGASVPDMFRRSATYVDNPKRRETWRFTDRAADQIRSRRQSQNRQGNGGSDSRKNARRRRRGD